MPARSFTLATWNVNSLRVRLPLVARYLDEVRPDVLCLQETRVGAAGFPHAAFEERGYNVAFTSTGGYAGVAIASRKKIDEVATGLPGFVETKAPGRRLACRIGKRWIDTVYVPTRTKIGKSEFLDALRADQDERFGAGAEVVLAGDFNICFDERDYASPKMISDPDVHPQRPEDLALRRLLDGRFVDVFRQVEDGSSHYSWFPNATWALKRKYGMRLDYVFASSHLASRANAARHDLITMSWPRPSDHVPVWVELGG
jgi:exodeoxyribonuclease-3